MFLEQPEKVFEDILQAFSIGRVFEPFGFRDNQSKEFTDFLNSVDINPSGYVDYNVDNSIKIRLYITSYGEMAYGRGEVLTESSDKDFAERIAIVSENLSKERWLLS